MPPRTFKEKLNSIIVKQRERETNIVNICIGCKKQLGNDFYKLGHHYNGTTIFDIKAIYFCPECFKEVAGGTYENELKIDINWNLNAS